MVSAFSWFCCRVLYEVHIFDEVLRNFAVFRSDKEMVYGVKLCQVSKTGTCLSMNLEKMRETEVLQVVCHFSQHQVMNQTLSLQIMKKNCQSLSLQEIRIKPSVLCKKTQLCEIPTILPTVVMSSAYVLSLF